MVDNPNRWPTTAELPSTDHTNSESDRIDLARPEINKGLLAQRKMATILNLSNLDDGDLPIYNANTNRFEPGRTSNIQRYTDHPVPTPAQLRYVAGAPFSIQRDLTPNYYDGTQQRFRFRSGPQTSDSVITQAVADRNGQWVNIGLPTNYPFGPSLYLLIQNISNNIGNPAGTQPLRISWNGAYLFQATPGFTFASGGPVNVGSAYTGGGIHDIPYNQTWQFKLTKITETTILITREFVIHGLAL